MERAKRACDEMNAALAELRKVDGYGRVRTFTTAYDPVTKRRGQLVFGNWTDAGFDVIYRTQGL